MPSKLRPRRTIITPVSDRSLRRTKVALIYKKTGNLHVSRLHGQLASTVRYLGIEVDDALQISEQNGSQSGTRLIRNLLRSGC
jgi:hypothetical protein